MRSLTLVMSRRVCFGPVDVGDRHQYEFELPVHVRNF